MITLIALALVAGAAFALGYLFGDIGGELAGLPAVHRGQPQPVSEAAVNPRLAPHNTRPLRRARTLAALRELDVAVCFDWRGFESFRARPYDRLTDDLPRGVEAAQNGSHGVREAS